ncbi:class C sortase [Schleiferilactobacillus shenzhenensis]|uniref:Uncharacterized protein n=1 Tax=Schleiferilactobacillus shenzhenensis LY-73 TaxID=1231336 RepID=U4TK81_9LACO|nr:class C sortase [Schleiferilactobacillus shenzhenensis]ERL64609.1 hypothetical protein L248_0793 [Schleiferilactobacillus shenzhenensis LY-73]
MAAKSRTVRRLATRRITTIERVSEVLIVIAIALYLYPIVANYFADQQRSVAVSNYDKKLAQMSKAQIAAELRTAEDYNQWLWASQRGIPAKPVPYTKVMAEDTVMGTLDIPAIDIQHMPFFHGDDENTLSKGLGHMPGTSIPIGGKNTRAVITGHTGVENQKLFSEVDKLQKGDVFYVHVLNRNLMYKIYKIEVVKPDRTDKVRIIKNQDTVTLLTCTPPGINSFRLLVTGKRHIPYVDPDHLHIVKRDFWSYEHIVLALLFLLLLVLLVGYLYRRHMRRLLANEGGQNNG